MSALPDWKQSQARWREIQESAPSVRPVTWRYWNTFTSYEHAMQAVRNAYANHYQFAFCYY
jgi:hypothetical protein